MNHIDPALLTQLITAGIAALTAFGALCVAITNAMKSKAERGKILYKLDVANDKLDVSNSKLDANTSLTQDTHTATNGLVDKLVAAAKTEAYAAGKADAAKEALR